MLDTRFPPWPPSDFVDDFAAGRRQAPRCDAKLRVSVRFSAQAEAVEGVPDPAELIGETRNLSETGLAVCVPSNHIGHRHLNLVGSELFLTLELPTGPVEMYATVRWCSRLATEGALESYVIGLRITEMNDEQWVGLVRYVHSLAK